MFFQDQFLLHLYPDNLFYITLEISNIMKWLFIAFILVLFSPWIIQAQTCITLQPDSSQGKDALLHGLISEVHTNYGTTPQLPAVAWTFQGIPGLVRSVVEFDLTSIPVYANILLAQLSLYAWGSPIGMGTHSSLSGPNDCWLERVTSPWAEWTVTWNSQPYTTTQNRVSLPASINGNQDYLNIDVTTLVQDMVIHPDSSFGFMLKIQDENYYRRMNFCSSDHPDRDKHPKLFVCYSIPTGLAQLPGRNLSLVLYPDPAMDKLFVKLDYADFSSHIILTIRNAVGETIRQVLLTSTTTLIELGKTAPGIYFYQLQNDLGIMNTGKITIE